MTALSEIYNSRIIELAAEIPRSQRLLSPDATATAHSKLCGSTITVDLKFKDGRVSEFGQLVKACLLGQAAASVVGREIVGSTVAELRSIGHVMRDMLKQDGAPPVGRWADLGVLQPFLPHQQGEAIAFGQRLDCTTCHRRFLRPLDRGNVLLALLLLLLIAHQLQMPPTARILSGFVSHEIVGHGEEPGTFVGHCRLAQRPDERLLGHFLRPVAIAQSPRQIADELRVIRAKQPLDVFHDLTS